MTGFIKAKSSFKDIIGIDLGTTNTLASIMKGNKPIIIPDFNGRFSIPSIVNFSKNSILIGEEAKKLQNSDPENTISASKRLIGRKYNDNVFLNADEYLKKLPYKIKKTSNNGILIATDHGKKCPTKIGAELLKYVREYSSNFLNKKITNAVITVPAYFNDNQRQATKDAGRIAGLNVIRLVNEPTAAALSYGLDNIVNGYVAVYDLGGGTFDITILEIKDGLFFVKSTNGNTFLGGEDFDSEFLKFLVNLFHSKEGIDLSENKEVLRKLKEKAVEAKLKLTENKQTNIFIENIVDGVDFDLNITREQFESVVKRVALKTVESCENAISDAGIAKKDISKVILVGGMSKVPLVQKIVKDIFLQKPISNINPDEAVAKGAAIQAGIIEGSVKDLLLLDVIPISLGIETLGGIFSKVIERNTTVPFKQTETFSTAKDNQTQIEVNIYQGERPFVADNILLGKMILKNIPKYKKGEAKIFVTFEADANGMLKVYAEDSNSKKKQEIEIKPSVGFTEDEIKKLIQDSITNRDNDNIKLERFKLKQKILEEIKTFTTGDISIPQDIEEMILNLEKMVNNTYFDIKKVNVLYNKILKTI